MSTAWALVPAKGPLLAKSRLRVVLEAEECALLSAAMLRDVLHALEHATGVEQVAVLTDDDSVAAQVSAGGHTVIRDADDDLCASLDSAATELAGRGADTLLVLPGDIPTLTAADVDALLHRHESGLSLCPAIRDGGSNAVVCTPPDAIPFCFGEHSAARHLAEAQQRGLTAHRLALPAFFRDIDLPDDLVWLGAQAGGTHTQNFLRRSGLGARLGPSYLSATG